MSLQQLHSFLRISDTVGDIVVIGKKNQLLTIQFQNGRVSAGCNCQKFKRYNVIKSPTVQNTSITELSFCLCNNNSARTQGQPFKKITILYSIG